MKQFFFLALMLVATITAKAKTIWTGSEAISWNGVTLTSDLFADANVGDQLVFTFTCTTNDNWPQLSIRNSSWADLPDSYSTGLNTDVTSATYYLTRAMLEELKAGGMVVTGSGFTLTAIDLNAGDGGADNYYSVWMGNYKIADWNSSLNVSVNCFTRANVGDVVRLRLANVQEGAQSMLKYVDSSWQWQDMTDITNLAAGATTADYTITNDMLTNMTNTDNHGVIITGSGYTLTAIDVLSSDVATRIAAPQTAVAPAKDNAVYNLAGQRVDNSYRGIVIVNGKKMIRR